MRDFKRQRGRRAQYLRMALGLTIMAAVGLVALGTGSAAWGMYGKFAEAAAADAAAQGELGNLQVQYASVSAQVDELGTARGIDAAVRERWGYGRPGEHEIDIVRDASSSPRTAGAASGFWSGLWQTLFGWL